MNEQRQAAKQYAKNQQEASEQSKPKNGETWPEKAQKSKQVVRKEVRKKSCKELGLKASKKNSG